MHTDAVHEASRAEASTGDAARAAMDAAGDGARHLPRWYELERLRMVDKDRLLAILGTAFGADQVRDARISLANGSTVLRLAGGPRDAPAFADEFTLDICLQPHGDIAMEASSPADEIGADSLRDAGALPPCWAVMGWATDASPEDFESLVAAVRAACGLGPVVDTFAIEPEPCSCHVLKQVAWGRCAAAGEPAYWSIMLTSVASGRSNDSVRDASADGAGASDRALPVFEGLDCSLQYGWLRGIEDYDLIRARLERG